VSADFPITIYHNPDCATSRNTLAMIRAAGYAPTVVAYLKAGWTRPLLDDLLARTQLTPRALLRETGSPAAELGLLDRDVADAAILSAMIEHPILVNRPIVVTPRGAALCRPSERIFDLLDRRPESFTKEDGERITPERS
jgi:arsenate reductase